MKGSEQIPKKNSESVSLSTSCFPAQHSSGLACLQEQEELQAAAGSAMLGDRKASVHQLDKILERNGRTGDWSPQSPLSKGLYQKDPRTDFCSNLKVSDKNKGVAKKSTTNTTLGVPLKTKTQVASVHTSVNSLEAVGTPVVAALHQLRPSSAPAQDRY